MTGFTSPASARSRIACFRSSSESKHLPASRFLKVAVRDSFRIKLRGARWQECRPDIRAHLLRTLPGLAARAVRHRGGPLSARPVDSAWEACEPASATGGHWEYASSTAAQNAPTEYWEPRLCRLAPSGGMSRPGGGKIRTGGQTPSCGQPRPFSPALRGRPALPPRATRHSAGRRTLAGPTTWPAVSSALGQCGANVFLNFLCLDRADAVSCHFQYLLLIVRVFISWCLSAVYSRYRKAGVSEPTAVWIRPLAKQCIFALRL